MGHLSICEVYLQEFASGENLRYNATDTMFQSLLRNDRALYPRRVAARGSLRKASVS